jgi:dUTP pyrophosphatase
VILTECDTYQITMSLYIYAEDKNLRDMLHEHLNTKHRWTDSGFDIPLLHGHSVGNRVTYNYTINLHVKVAAVDVDQTRPCLLLPRSSLSKTAVRLANSIGLIDQGYRGEVQAKVDIVDPAKGDIHAGERLFQICRHDFLPWNDVILVDSENELPPPPDTRGSGGFGSTGR